MLAQIIFVSMPSHQGFQDHYKQMFSQVSKHLTGRVYLHTQIQIYTHTYCKHTDQCPLISINLLKQSQTHLIHNSL